MDKRNLPKIKNDGIFSKIRLFILKFINKKSYNDVDNNTRQYDQNDDIQDLDFKSIMKSQSQYDILFIQNKLKLGKIAISDLSDIELDEMINLYKEQIKQKEDKLKNYRKKITSA